MTHIISAHNIEHVVTAVIVANAALMVTGMLVDGHEAAFEKMDLAVLWFFAAELSVRLAMARLGFFHSLWNTVDLVVVVLALLPIAGGGIAVLRLARLARSAHLLRHVAHLRLARLARHGYHMLRGRRHAGQMQLPRRDGGRRFTS
jgi:Ion transport protein